jgi:hypothetical protein
MSDGSGRHVGPILAGHRAKQAGQGKDDGTEGKPPVKPEQIAGLVVWLVLVVAWLAWLHSPDEDDVKQLPQTEARATAPRRIHWKETTIQLHGAGSERSMSSFPGCRSDIMTLADAIEKHPTATRFVITWRFWEEDWLGDGGDTKTVKATYNRKKGMMLFDGYDLYIKDIPLDAVVVAAEEYRTDPLRVWRKADLGVFTRLGYVAF